jgi:hypothetical protein
MEVVGPVYGIDLLVLAAVAGKLPSVGYSLVACFDLLSLHATTINHDAATSTCPPPEPGLVLVRNIIWRCSKPYPSTSARF